SGNTASSVSGSFTVAAKPSPEQSAVLVVTLTFDPPTKGSFTPPTNLMANAVEDRNGQSSGKQNAGVITPSALSDEPEAVVGYNIYRVPAPLPGQPAPTPEQIVQPANLVGSTTGNSSSFTDKVTTGNSGQSSGSGNYTYSATSFFGNGTQSSGSNTAGTDLPV